MLSHICMAMATEEVGVATQASLAEVAVTRFLTAVRILAGAGEARHSLSAGAAVKGATFVSVAFSLAEDKE